MKITLVSHASLLVETRGRRILTDPWYGGTIYNRAWELCPAPPRLPSFADLDALFISHAHPDHYHPPTLERILAARGPDLPVFIARFFNDGIRRDLERIGFRRVIEMRPGREFSPFPGITFYSQQFRLDDSLLVIRGDETLININDTPLRGRVLEALARRYPNPEYVAAQFAIAQGYPYCYELAVPDFDRRDLVRRFDSYAHTLKPRHMIPFASYVRFSHEDNAHMNGHKMGLDELLQVTTAKLTVLYPGDSIEQCLVHHEPAHRALFDAAQQKTGAISEREPVPAKELDGDVERFLTRLASGAPAFLRRRVPPFAFVPTDQSHGYRIGNGRVRRATVAELDATPIRYHLASEVLRDCLRHDWGWADLSIGARFRAYVQPGWEGREIWFWIVPMLAGEGYLRFWTLWFLRPRALTVWWGRRLEIFDYLRSMIGGRFMSQVVRKKTSALSPAR